MRRPFLITVAAVVIVAAVAVLLWRPWQERTTFLTELAYTDFRGYLVQANDLKYQPPATDASATYDLAGRFTTFETSVVLRDGAAGGTAQVRVDLDGNVEYEAELVPGDPPRTVKLPVSGIGRITLWTETSGSPAGEVVWAQPRVS